MIKLEQITAGMEHGDIAVVDSPNGDGAVCQIGDNWFYFGGQEAEEMTAAEYLANAPKALADYIDILQTQRCAADGAEDLRALAERLKEKKGYGG